MKEKLFLILSLMLFFGCNQKADLSLLSEINGYWQIKKATDKEGKKTDYPVNEIFDYFEIKGKTGFHKKVKWQPDGTFLVNDLSETIKIVDNEEAVLVEFTSKFGKHTEKLISISKAELILETANESKLIFEKVKINNGKTK